MKTFLMSMLLVMTIPVFAQNSYKKKQLKFERVKNAYDEKWDEIREALIKQKYTHVIQLYIAAYKSEGILEVWIKSPSQERYKLFRTYHFCGYSGTLGPKFMEGDGQTPEGFYQINVFNPVSNFHLSLGINYPNSVDLARAGKEKNPGSDIYIHGDCVTVGCIPITDDKIKEVYILAVEARNNGQMEIPVHIFPFRMTPSNFKKYTAEFPQYLSFWENLKSGYVYFDQYKTLPLIREINGSYALR